MLNDLMLKYGSDKAPHGFCEFYESFFAPVRKEVKSVLEIGIADGASMRGWLDYFPNAKVYGLDAPYDALGRYGDSAHWPLDTGRFLAFIGDQADRDDLARLVEHGPWDIIIDDGGHTMEQQQVSLGVLFPYATRFYVVEDLHTSFMDKIALYEKGKPVRSYPTGASDMLTTYDYLQTLYPDAHIFDRDGDHKHMTAVLESSPQAAKEGTE